jgi:hypothetical protein
MKAILLALTFGALLLAWVTFEFNRDVPDNRAWRLLRAFLILLPLLVLTHTFTPAGLGFLPLSMIAPLAWVDLVFCVFLFFAGFFGGVLQLYNLADRGLSLRMLIDIIEAPDASMTAEELVTGYSAGHGIRWMYEKRLEGMQRTGVVRLVGPDVSLTPKGRKIAELFGRLQKFAGVYPSRGVRR